MPTTAVRAPSRHHSTLPGTGELHRALEDSRDLGRLHNFCSAHVCTAAQVSIDGKRLDMLKVFDLMRARGYEVSAPAKSPHQPRNGFTAWLVDITLPNRTSVSLAFFTPDTS